MASLILAELDRGEFSLLHFYERRIRRIFPALFVVIAASACAGLIWFMPIELMYFGRSAIAAALFGSNILFWLESGYFDTAAQLKPLLHTWSLAVEEQFYILFPLVLILSARIGKRFTQWALMALCAASFTFSLFLTERAPAASFYLSPSRFWELLLGSLLALEILPRSGRSEIREACAVLGLGVIGLAVFACDGSTRFSGLDAAIPCIGAALVIWSGAKGDLKTPILGAPALVFVGLTSYSLYLWHWPLLVFARYLAGGELSVQASSLTVGAAFVLATASWYFVERPFRGRSSFIAQRKMFPIAAVGVATTLVFGGLVVAEKGMPWRLPRAAQSIYSAAYDVGPFSNEHCFIDANGQGPSVGDIRSGALCHLGAAAKDGRFLVWGDSHAAAMAPAIDRAAAEAGYGGLMIGRGGCPPLLDFDFGEWDPRRTSQCREFNDAVFDLIASRHIATVFMVALWPKYVHRGELQNKGPYFEPSRKPPAEDWSAPVAKSLDFTLRRLSQLGTRAVLVMDVPEIGYNVPDALAKAAMTGKSIDISPSWTSVSQRQELARKVLKSYAAKYGFAVVDPLPALCDAQRCRVEKDGIILYHDTNHLSASGARSLAGLYRPVFASLERSTAP